MFVTGQLGFRERGLADSAGKTAVFLKNSTTKDRYVV